MPRKDAGRHAPCYLKLSLVLCRLRVIAKGETQKGRIKFPTADDYVGKAKSGSTGDEPVWSLQQEISAFHSATP